eukprot:354346-Chlamydomonas_euryale.AAC.22
MPRHVQTSRPRLLPCLALLLLPSLLLPTAAARSLYESDTDANSRCKPRRVRRPMRWAIVVSIACAEWRNACPFPRLRAPFSWRRSFCCDPMVPTSPVFGPPVPWSQPSAPTAADKHGPPPPPAGAHSAGRRARLRARGLGYRRGWVSRSHMAHMGVLKCGAA